MFFMFLKIKACMIWQQHYLRLLRVLWAYVNSNGTLYSLAFCCAAEIQNCHFER